MRPHPVGVTALLLGAVLACSAASARAQWPDGLALKVGTSLTAQGLQDGRILPGDGPNDFYAFFGSDAGASCYRVWEAAHLDVHGFSLWSPDSEFLQQSDCTAKFGIPAFGPTGSGGYVNVYTGTSSGGVLRLVVGAADGTQSVPVNLATGASSDLPAACALPGGGAMVLWAGSPGPARLLRLDASGSVSAGWPAAGWKTHFGGSLLNLVADGAGGVIAAWGSDVHVGRFSAADTVVAAGWPASGLPLTQSGTGDYFYAVQLVPVDDQHFAAVWQDIYTSHIVAQRFSLSGSIDPAWPADGVVLGTADLGQHGPNCVPDGAGGLTVGWMAYPTYWVRHVLADGSLPGAYAGGPLGIMSSSGLRSGALAKGVADDVCILLERFGEIRARWLDANGQSLGCTPGDTCSVLVRSNDNIHNLAGAMGDGSGGAYFLFDKNNLDGTGDHSNYVSHVNHFGPPAAVEPPVEAGATLALAVAPNPAAGAITARFTLAGARPARLEVVDLAGRRVLVRDVSGVGSHVESLAGSEPLAPGVYLVRLIDAGQTRAARAVVLH